MNFKFRISNFELRAMSTAEAMVMTVAISLVILATYGGSFSAFKTYREMVNRERSLLYAQQTLEEIEAIRLTRMKQNYENRWGNFLGDKQEGLYRIVRGESLSEIDLLVVSEYEEGEETLKIYEDDGDGFYSRLERRIYLEGNEEKKVTVAVYWGIPGNYEEEGRQQLRVQALYSNN